MPTCEDLRLGGTLSGSGITGGVTINQTNLAVDDWSDIFGHGGLSYTPVEVLGRAGAYPVGDGLPLARFPTLNMRLRSAHQCPPGEDLTDTFLALLADSGGQYLEVDIPDEGSRFIKVYGLTPASILQPRQIRTVKVPLFSPDPYWKEGGAQNTDTISGADSLAVGGVVNVYDAVLVFAGDGALVHNDLDWTLTISGSSGPVTVDLGNRTVTMGGNPADYVLGPSSRHWGWFIPGTNSLSSSVSTTVTWRDQYN